MLTGKGMYIHAIKQCEGGDPAKIAQLAKDAGLTHVLVKVLDGPYYYNLRPVKGGAYVDDILQPLIDALHGNDIDVWGWQYVYLQNPVQEATNALARIRELGLDGFVIDAEVEAKKQATNAVTYARLLNGCRVPVALSTYRFPKLHNDFPWKQLLEPCSLVMPQVYWMKATNSSGQLIQCVDEYKAVTKLPMVPTGAAFTERGWTASADQVLAFMKMAHTMGLSAVNFWKWDHARKLGLWQTIADYPYPSDRSDDNNPPTPPTTPLTLHRWVVENLYPWAQTQGYTGVTPPPETFV